jgi:hypothetical protein
MYNRLLDKSARPSSDFIRNYIGVESDSMLLQLEEFLKQNYQLTRELKFPFGNHYGWGYKYSHKSSHICYAFFEEGAFTVTIQLGDNCVSKLEQIKTGLSPKGIELWQNRYPCGSLGGWIHYRVSDQNDLMDVIELIKVKKPVVLS